jgi:hypothetical protein
MIYIPKQCLTQTLSKTTSNREPEGVPCKLGLCYDAYRYPCNAVAPALVQKIQKKVILQQKWWRVVNTVSIFKDFIAVSFQNLEQDGRGCECARYGVSLKACDNSDNLQNHRGHL